MYDSYVSFRAGIMPRSPAVITLARTFSFAELDADVTRMANGLAARGLSPASGVVAVQIGDAYHELLATMALARLRIASSPGHDAKADLRLSDVSDGFGEQVHLPLEWFAATLAAEPTPVVPPAFSPDAIGRVLMSSGTTQTPRRIGLTWRMVDANVRNSAITWCAGKVGRWMPLTGLDSMMGLGTTLTAWAVGATVVVGQSNRPLPETLERLQPTLIAFTPNYLRNLLRQLPPGFRPLPDLRLVVGGAILPKALAQETRLRLTSDLQIVYGSTECSAMAHADATLLDTIPGATGYPGPDVRVDILDPDGQPVAPGEAGEVRIVCPRAAQGYIDDAEASAKAFHDGGFYPGDVGRILADGLLVLEGRADDRMNLGGRKFMPNVLEDAAMSCPGVGDAAAFAAPGDDGLDQCWLAVVQGVGFDRERLVAHLNGYGDALPRLRFAWIAEIPRNAMGKIERNRLRDETMAVLGGGPPA
jgi:acyl-CoA synthetase (AMP-forming)/AMP-acid ligase II